jgi:hypothetical protein
LASIFRFFTEYTTSQAIDQNQNQNNLIMNAVSVMWHKETKAAIDATEELRTDLCNSDEFAAFQAHRKVNNGLPDTATATECCRVAYNLAEGAYCDAERATQYARQQEIAGAKGIASEVELVKARDRANMAAETVAWFAAEKFAGFAKKAVAEWARTNEDALKTAGHGQDAARVVELLHCEAETIQNARALVLAADAGYWSPDARTAGQARKVVLMADAHANISHNAFAAVLEEFRENRNAVCLRYDAETVKEARKILAAPIPDVDTMSVETACRVIRINNIYAAHAKEDEKALVDEPDLTDLQAESAKKDEDPGPDAKEEKPIKAWSLVEAAHQNEVEVAAANAREDQYQAGLKADRDYAEKQVADTAHLVAVTSKQQRPTWQLCNTMDAATADLVRAAQGVAKLSEWLQGTMDAAHAAFTFWIDNPGLAAAKAQAEEAIKLTASAKEELAEGERLVAEKQDALIATKAAFARAK